MTLPLSKTPLRTMPKRFKTEESLLWAIDRLHVLHDKDCREIERLHQEVVQSKADAAQRGQQFADGVNYKRAMIWTIEKRMRGRQNRLSVLKALLGEFRTLTLPLVVDVMGGNSVKRR